MKIEKVNDYQIRCTLTREDLVSRNLKITELAYGTKKAKTLFQDLMEMANDAYGFEADNIPLMIEAIPVNTECLVLIITKVEDPEELDTRFSKFSPIAVSSDDEDDDELDDDDISDTWEDGAESFKKHLDKLMSLGAELSASKPLNIKEVLEDASAEAEKKSGDETPSLNNMKAMGFSFDSINDVIEVSKRITKEFDSRSFLYKSLDDDSYMLILLRGQMDILDFVKVCNLVSEFGKSRKSDHVEQSFIDEHYDVICSENALETMAGL